MSDISPVETQPRDPSIDLNTTALNMLRNSNVPVCRQAIVGLERIVNDPRAVTIVGRDGKDVQLSAVDLNDRHTISFAFPVPDSLLPGQDEMNLRRPKLLQVDLVFDGREYRTGFTVRIPDIGATGVNFFSSGPSYSVRYENNALSVDPSVVILNPGNPARKVAPAAMNLPGDNVIVGFRNSKLSGVVKK